MVANRPEGGAERARRGGTRPGFRVAPAPRNREKLLSRLRRPAVVRTLIALVCAIVLIPLVPLLWDEIRTRTRGPVTVTDFAANANGTIESGDTRYRVTLLAVSAGATIPGTNLPPALEGRTYVTARVSAQNLGSAVVVPGAWTLLMTDDVDRFPLSVAGPEGASMRADLAPGATNTYTLYFDVPTDGKRVKSLFYRDASSDGAIRFAMPVAAA